MGRPLVVRSPEEEAALAQRRREIARERARRRRADPTLRAADAAAHRQRRAQQPEVRDREAQWKRQRRAENPELRRLEAQAKRRRRATDPEFRERDVRAKRQRRANDPRALRQRWQRDGERPGLTSAAYDESLPNGSATTSFRTEDEEGGGPLVKCTRRLESRVSCAVCDRLCLDSQVAPLPLLKGEAFKVLSEHYPGVDRKSLCSHCRDSLIRGVPPAFSTVNGEESKMPPRPPPPPPQPQRPEAGQILLLVKQDGGAASTGRLLLPRPMPQPPPQQVLLHVGDPTTMFMATDCSTMQTAAVPAEVTTTRLQQPVVGSGGMLLEQQGSADTSHPQGPAPVLQQRHVLANGQPPPDPDSIPVLEPITAEEHFHAEMLHQTIKQTALLQDMLSAQQRMAEAAERQAQAAEEQSHALSQLALFLIENHRSNRNSGANLSSSVVDDSSCPEATTPLSITPEILQVEHST
ncbi:mediator of RNA polymerase II transcription subunit 1.1 isoform X2 [Rhipicephalus sanguineus]|uniref:mediator of RNA polymerase II transcription subunit 1.1 isoform X2 n=1 Tax=Rhipicephalus sanguineus TaxID=34632 RepID=UPI0020C2AC64|nr:mediator of RNA polymerase II transcription subunit 1.1 isoform X2 [Rhipicephalus sanguineus]